MTQDVYMARCAVSPELAEALASLDEEQPPRRPQTKVIFRVEFASSDATAPCQWSRSRTAWAPRGSNPEPTECKPRCCSLSEVEALAA